jgi:hypothetical protein
MIFGGARLRDRAIAAYLAVRLSKAFTSSRCSIQALCYIPGGFFCGGFSGIGCSLDVVIGCFGGHCMRVHRGWDPFPEMFAAGTFRWGSPPFFLEFFRRPFSTAPTTVDTSARRKAPTDDRRTIL